MGRTNDETDSSKCDLCGSMCSDDELSTHIFRGQDMLMCIELICDDCRIELMSEPQ